MQPADKQPKTHRGLYLPKEIVYHNWPKAPEGWSQREWFDRQLFLKSKGCPADVIATIDTPRRMNLFVLALSFPTNVYFQPDYKWVLDNEHNPAEINKLLIWKHKLNY